jgi:uncharacterized protein
MNRPPTLTEADLDRLAAFLASEAAPAGAMNLAQLEGFLTAIVIGPSVVPPSAWMPWLWDAENGEDAPTFESMAQAQEVLGLIMGFMNRIAEAFVRDPAAFRPLFLIHPRWTAEDWCGGFLQATQTFDAEAWTRLWAVDAVQHPPGADRAGCVTPFIRLGDDDGRAVTQRVGDAQRWVDALVPTLAALHGHWLAERRPAVAPAPRGPQRREAPKVGRNDPCPCGSGQKFKKCCGQEPTLH